MFEQDVYDSASEFFFLRIESYGDCMMCSFADSDH